MTHRKCVSHPLVHRTIFLYICLRKIVVKVFSFRISQYFSILFFLGNRTNERTKQKNFAHPMKQKAWFRKFNSILYQIKWHQLQLRVSVSASHTENQTIVSFLIFSYFAENHLIACYFQLQRNASIDFFVVGGSNWMA